LRRAGLGNGAVRYRVRAATVRSGGRLAAHAVLGLRISRLSLAAILLLLRRLLLLVGTVAGGRAIAAKTAALVAAAEEEKAENGEGERSRECTHN
jgi:hypothetical protein